MRTLYRLASQALAASAISSGNVFNLFKNFFYMLLGGLLLHEALEKIGALMHYLFTALHVALLLFAYLFGLESCYI